MIWEQIQSAKQSKSDLHVVWLDLTNAYGSVLLQLIYFTLDFFHIPPQIWNLVESYFNSYPFLQTITVSCSVLGLIADMEWVMGCSISPILFTAAFEINLISGKQMVRGFRSQSGQQRPALQSYIDDVTTLLQTSACTARLLKRLEELLSWAKVRIKPSKSHSLSIRKGVRNDNISFTADGVRSCC